MSKTKKYFLLSTFFLILLIPKTSEAISGACSWHSGVNCSLGRQSNGKVYCNDGWTDSMADYDFMVECKNNTEDIIWKQLYYDGKVVNPKTDWDSSYRTGVLVMSCPYSSTPKYDYSNIGNIDYCKCNEGYYNYDTGNLKNYSNQKCEKGEPFVSALIYVQLAADKAKDSINEVKRTNLSCQRRYGYNSELNSNGDCKCEKGYRWIYAAYEKMVYCVKRDDHDEIMRANINTSQFSGGGGGGYAIPEGALIRAIGDIDVYIIKYVGSKKFKRLVLSPSVFNNYGHLKWENIMDVDKSTVDSFITSELVRVAGDDRIYRLYPSGDTGQKRLIKNNAVLSKYGLDSDSIYEINSFDRDSYIAGPILE